MPTKRAQNAANGSLDSPEPAGGAYSAPPDPLAGFRGEGWDWREGHKNVLDNHFMGWLNKGGC